MLYSADAYTLATPAAVLDKFGADHTCVDQPLALINRSVKLSQTKRNVSKLRLLCVTEVVTSLCSSCLQQSCSGFW